MQVSAGAPPSGVVTFVFTDIEGSTRRWETDADAMRVALAAHDKVLRTAIEAHDGLVFSHSGDGIAAAFASPMAAVQAAIGAQRELQLPVRMGIATGEAELRDNDYFGTVLNRAARVMAAGHGGQVLVADSTAGLLSGVDLVDLGPRRLRDLPNPIGIFQLQAPGLRSDFPPLRTIDSTTGNLRPAAGTLIGRNAEVPEVARAVRSHRLVTLAGVGGVGKTRLALEVASRSRRRIPRRRMGFRIGRSYRSHRCSRRGGGGARCHSTAGHDGGPVSRGHAWRAGSVSSYSTIVSTSSTPQRIWSRRFSRNRPP